jgi:hypothetical protein
MLRSEKDVSSSGASLRSECALRRPQLVSGTDAAQRAWIVCGALGRSGFDGAAEAGMIGVAWVDGNDRACPPSQWR